MLGSYPPKRRTLVRIHLPLLRPMQNASVFFFALFQNNIKSCWALIRRKGGRWFEFNHITTATYELIIFIFQAKFTFDKPIYLLKMYTVYILYSEKYKIHYVGFTSDLNSRLLSHNELATKGFTVKYRPWRLIYTETFQTKKEAMSREKFFKSGTGRRLISTLPH
jgi:putative endonuclease